jgi:hypothetical protein
MNEKYKCDMKKSPNQAPVYSNSADYYCKFRFNELKFQLSLKAARLPETVTAW